MQAQRQSCLSSSFLEGQGKGGAGRTSTRQHGSFPRQLSRLLLHLLPRPQHAGSSPKKNVGPLPHAHHILTPTTALWVPTLIILDLSFFTTLAKTLCLPTREIFLGDIRHAISPTEHSRPWGSGSSPAGIASPALMGCGQCPLWHERKLSLRDACITVTRIKVILRAHVVMPLTATNLVALLRFSPC